MTLYIGKQDLTDRASSGSYSDLLSIPAGTVSILVVFQGKDDPALSSAPNLGGVTIPEVTGSPQQVSIFQATSIYFKNDISARTDDYLDYTVQGSADESRATVYYYGNVGVGTMFGATDGGGIGSGTATSSVPVPGASVDGTAEVIWVSSFDYGAGSVTPSYSAGSGYGLDRSSSDVWASKWAHVTISATTTIGCSWNGTWYVLSAGVAVYPTDITFTQDPIVIEIAMTDQQVTGEDIYFKQDPIVIEIAMTDQITPVYAPAKVQLEGPPGIPGEAAHADTPSAYDVLQDFAHVGKPPKMVDVRTLPGSSPGSSLYLYETHK